jgi:hypothetical protein
LNSKKSDVLDEVSKPMGLNASVLGFCFWITEEQNIYKIVTSSRAQHLQHKFLSHLMNPGIKA